MYAERRRAPRITLVILLAGVASAISIALALRHRNSIADPLQLGWMAHKAGDFDKAMSHFDEAVAAVPADPAALTARGDAHYGVNNLDAALADYNRLIATRPRDAVARHQRARALLGLGREEEMFAELDRALDLDPSLGEARFQRAWVRFNRGDFDAAIHDLDRLVEEPEIRGGESLIEIRALRAETRLSTGDDAGALADLDALRDIGGDARDIDQTTVWALWGMNAYDDALQILDRLLADDPTSANLQLARGLTLMHLGHHDESLAALAGLRDRGSSVPPEADLFLWVAQMRAGDPASAASDLPPDAHFTRWHAMIARHLRGDIGEMELLAVANLEKDPYKRARMLCEASYYAGMKQLFAGDRTDAIALLQQCVDTEIRRYYEFHAAVAELARLSKPGAPDD